MKRLWFAIAAVLLAACQSDSAPTAATSDKSREAAERDRKINSVQEQMRNMSH